MDWTNRTITLGRAHRALANKKASPKARSVLLANDVLRLLHSIAAMAEQAKDLRESFRDAEGRCAEAQRSYRDLLDIHNAALVAAEARERRDRRLADAREAALAGQITELRLLLAQPVERHQ